MRTPVAIYTNPHAYAHAFNDSKFAHKPPVMAFHISKYTHYTHSNVNRVCKRMGVWVCVCIYIYKFRTCSHWVTQSNVMYTNLCVGVCVCDASLSPQQFTAEQFGSLKHTHIYTQCPHGWMARWRWVSGGEGAAICIHFSLLRISNGLRAWGWALPKRLSLPTSGADFIVCVHVRTWI